MDATKRCTNCTTEKSTDDFGKNRAKPDGLQDQCKDCRKVINSTYYHNSKETQNPKRYANKRAAQLVARDFVYGYLLEHPCVDCGETDPMVLQFDHQGDKLYNVSKMVTDGYSVVTISTEIAKCEVVCANDHQRRTSKQQGWWKLKNLETGS